MSGLASAAPATRRVDVRDRVAGAVYVGRAAPRAGLAGSPFANPFRVDVDGSRDDVVARYREWILGEPGLLGRLHELHGRPLACWCPPGLACHADVLAALVEAEATLRGLVEAGVRVEVAGDRLRLHPADPAATLEEKLVERARRYKAEIRGLLATVPPLPDPRETWLAAVDRLAETVHVPPEILADLRAAKVKWS
ncbi:MAG: DUF4326 domain-containing protein [Planctomycetota bacterium]